MDDIKQAAPGGDREPSGRFVLRIPPELHGALRAAARASGLSLNEYCARKLAEANAIPAEGAVREAASAIVRRAVTLLGEDVLGILVIGSWARGEDQMGSDLDVLIVVGPEVPISRGLYRKWDAEPRTWEGRAVDAHFVRLPPRDDPIAGIWADSAVDGIVIFDRDLSLSRRLGALRRRILAGEATRRMAHGQPYWVHEGPPEGAKT